jgi:hypothetical protein
MFAFLSLLFVLIVIFLHTASPIEGFRDVPPSHIVTIPTIPPATSLLPDPISKASRSPMEAKESDPVSPYTLPGQLPIAPYGQVATMSPLPYQDTTLIKANRQQIISLLEMLKGFLSFEAQEISEKSDPSIQLPLSNARSDLQVLQNAVDLLNRNPGLQPSITLTTLNEMSSNLSYLQEQVRLIGTAGALQGPINEFTEGFEDRGRWRRGPRAYLDSVSGFTGATGTNGPSNQRATVSDLNDFIARIQGEIIRLSASGTTDPIVAARVSALTHLKHDINSIVDKVTGNVMPASDIPILKSDIVSAFPALGNPSEPIPRIVRNLGLSPGLANLLPSNIRRDPDTMREIKQLIDKYADQIVNGVSASFSVKYTAPRDAEIAHAMASTIDHTGFPSVADLNNVSNAKFTPAASSALITDRLAPTPMDAGRGPSHFDWKQRAKDIETQIKKRQLNPNDFGVMPEGTRVSNEFSWKGYTRMLCTRLQATSDPSLPETCGCPPLDWKGWRIAK